MRISDWSSDVCSSDLPGKSDTWHFVTDVLRPLAQRHVGLLSDYAFVQILELGLRADTKLALLDQRLRRIVIVNRAYGVEVDGLRSEERRGGQECVSPFRSGWSEYHEKKK